MAKKKKSLRITYNAPVTLTYSIWMVVILLVNQFLFQGLISSFFTAPGKIGSDLAFNWTSVLDYIRLFTHVLGHQDWNHLLGNITFILLLGPLLEERYGSGMLTLMIVITALVTGVINACFIPRPMVGASGVAFMMILLSSFTAISKNQIPLTFLLVLVLFIGRELATGFQNKDVATWAHIVGGLCGSLFGFLTAHSPRRSRASKTETSNKGERSSEVEKRSDKAGSNKAVVSSTSKGSISSPQKTPTGDVKASKNSSATASAKKTATKKPGPEDDFDIYAEEATFLFGDDES